MNTAYRYKVGEVFNGRKLLNTYTRKTPKGRSVTVYQLKCESCGREIHATKMLEVLDAVCGSCGPKANLTHGYSGKSADPAIRRVYRIAYGAMVRCHHRPHADYGQRGIRVAEEFHDLAKFTEYLCSLDGWDDPSLSIDRKDVNRGYERGNLQWATSLHQFYNRRGVGAEMRYRPAELMKGG